MLDNSVDLTVTSPPSTIPFYGTRWNGMTQFSEHSTSAVPCYKAGYCRMGSWGCVFKRSESGTSFKQALTFMELGFNCNTMIYEKNSSSFPARSDSKRYSQIFEYMFVFVKGKIRDDIKLIADKKNKWAGWTTWGSVTNYNQKGDLKKVGEGIKPVPEFSLRTNIWKYSVGGFNDKAKHPAVFPGKNWPKIISYLGQTSVT